jgi:5'-3' exonuclease
MADNKKTNRYILTDGANLFYRQIKMTNPALGIDSMIGMSLHLILNSMKREYNTHNGTHVVFFLEGRSWRKDIYPDYKANRKIAFAQQTEKEQEDHKILTEAFDDFVKYLDEKTNITVLRNSNAEADDMISIWIKAHPDDDHFLISSDSDFFQLLKHPNVTIYDPVKNIIIKQDGIYNDAGKRLAFEVNTNAKIKVGDEDPNFVCEPQWYEYALFLKCVRGDVVDNIFSAYPGVREKGTKKNVGIREAYEDRDGKGYDWNNFMLQRWVDHNGNEQRVKERIELNRKLIDLDQIPDEIMMDCMEVIAATTQRKNVPAVEVGYAFMKFCGKWDLKRIGDNADTFMNMMKAKYKE